jgi:transcriptional regulator with XRE-family HTH domain
VIFNKAKFGQFFNTLRAESGLSMAEVAKKTGLATTTVFSIEQGDGRVSMSQFFSVATLFGIQPDIMLAKFCRRERAMSGLRKRTRSVNTNGKKPANAKAAA